jgi:HK97 family phage portal protein
MGMKTEDIALLDQFWDPQNRLAARPDPDRSIIHFTRANPANVLVTEDTALQVSTIWACVTVLSNALASSDWNVFEKLPNNDRELLYNDNVHYLLNTRPNEEMTAKAAKQALVMAACFAGNGFWEISRDMARRPAALWPIAPDRVEPKRDADGSRRLWWKVNNDDGTWVRIEVEDMIHIPGPGITGLIGDSVISRAAMTISLSIAAETFAASYFGNGTFPGILLEAPNAGAMDDVTYERLKKEFEGRHRGASRAFRFGVLEGGYKIHEIQTDAQKAQMTEARKYQIEEICRWFGVPPHKVAHLVHSTLSNIEHLGMEFARDTLRPWARVVQEEVSYKLFSVRSRPRFILVDLDWASQGDFKSRTDAYRNMRDLGAYSVNDVLKAEGKNTIGAEGDIRTVSSASIRLEDVGKNFETEPATEDDEDAVADVGARWLEQVVARAKRRFDNKVKQGCQRASAERDAVNYVTEELQPLREVVNFDDAVITRLFLSVLDDSLPPSTAARSAIIKRKKA